MNMNNTTKQTKQENYQDNYFSRIRPDILRLVQGEKKIILEVGCGFGVTAGVLVEKGVAKFVIGAEINYYAALQAKANIGRVVCCDIEKSPFICKNYFDYIIFADVLEHLRDPGATLTRCREMLKPDGKILACLPNIKNWRILRDLVFFDKFEYSSAGILDRTHLRFFTLSSAKKLFTDCGYEIIDSMLGMTGPKHRLLNKITCGIFKKFFAYAIYIVATKGSTKKEI
jgi:SAM-dependent methyltransferase